MEHIEQLRTYYAEYNEKAVKVRREAPMFAGVLGLGNSPKNHPCHTAFYEQIQAWTESFVASQPGREAAVEVTRWFLDAPLQYKKEDGFMYMFVCIGFIRPLIPLMHKEDCGELAKYMNERYPRRDRLPIHDDVYKQLLKAGK